MLSDVLQRNTGVRLSIKARIKRKDTKTQSILRFSITATISLIEVVAVFFASLEEATPNRAVRKGC